MLHCQGMHSQVPLPHSCAFLQWISSNKRFILAVCVHSLAHFYALPRLLQWTLALWSQRQNTAELGFHSLFPLPSSYKFSAVASPHNFFPRTSRKETRAPVYCNTQPCTQRVTCPRVWTPPHSPNHTALNTELSDAHMKIYLVIYFQITDNTFLFLHPWLM